MKTDILLRLMAALAVGILVLFAPLAHAQEVVITDFPLGVGGDIEPDFFEPYYPQLQAVADTLAAYPLARAVIVGSADGYRYEQDHDAKNPGLSVGRAHALLNVLIDVFAVDSTQLIVQSKDVPWAGGEYRSASVRVDRELAGLDSRLGTPRVDTQIVRMQEVTREVSDIGLRFSAGVSSSPYGGIPVVSAAITWKRTIFVEVLAGHQFWTSPYKYGDADLSTWCRMVGADVLLYPWPNTPVGFLAGWYRTEDLARDYQEYVQLSEGPVLGVTATPLKWASIAGMWQPSRQRIASEPESEAEIGQFLFRVTVHTEFGGAR